MSRNRNVRKKLDSTKNTNILVSRNKDQFTWRKSAENIINNNYIYDSIDGSNLDEIEHKCSGQLSSGQSTSSSSLSWAEDCEADATRFVAEEYERMLRVLQRLEPIPPRYDKDEYKLWIKTFPCLSLIDRHSASSTNADEDNWHSARQYKPTSLENYTVIQNASKSSNPVQISRNKSVRNNISPDTNKLINTTLNPMTIEQDLYSFLTISHRPAMRKLPEVSNKFNKLYVKEDNSRCKDEEQFNSLPPLFTNSAINGFTRKTSAYRKNDYFQPILPALETDLSKHNSGRFRSISAVCRDFLHVSKCPSALSINNRDRTTKKGSQDAATKHKKNY